MSARVAPEDSDAAPTKVWLTSPEGTGPTAAANADGGVVSKHEGDEIHSRGVSDREGLCRGPPIPHHSLTCSGLCDSI